MNLDIFEPEGSDAFAGLCWTGFTDVGGVQFRLIG